MSFAVKLTLGEAKLEDCPLLTKEEYKENYEKLKEILKPLTEAFETGLRLDEEKCTGCGNCVIVCPANVAAEKEVARGTGPKGDEVVFRVENGVSKIINLQRCRRFPPDRINCRVCEEYCYTRAIEIF